MRGGYAGHGETYADPEDLIWWAKGGELHGEAWKRIGFLRDLLEEDVKNGLTPMGRPGQFPWSRVSGAIDGDVRYIYLGEHQPVIWATGFPAGGRRLRDRPHRHLGHDGTRAEEDARRRRTIRRATAARSAAASRTRRSASSCRASPIWRSACARSHV